MYHGQLNNLNPTLSRMTLPDTISDYSLSIENLQFFNEPPPEDLLFETLFSKGGITDSSTYQTKPGFL